MDARPVEVPNGKASELLARLALEAGELVSAERLVEDLWASTTTEVRRNTLQSKVAMLRRALGPASVASRDGGYALEVEADHVDVLAVQRAATTAARLREGGEPEQAAELCGSALRLFGGTPLQVAGDAEWASVPRTRVEEAHTTLLEVRFWARLELGGAGSVIGELEGAVAEYPFHEGLWELLITALYRTGRQADALAAFQRVRTLLGEELGLDPGPALQELERDILAQDVAAAPLAAASDGSGGPRGNLPSMSAGLVGRDADVQALAELLSRERLVEVIGPGGIGKTALALDVGRRLLASDAVDAVWLARLENTVTRADVVDVLIAALHGPGSEAALFERLRASSALVILDNCEHVVEVAADLAVRLLDHAPALHILCTSQLALEIDGERVVELAPLELSDAVELFGRRASRLTGTPRDDESVLDLCRSLDGLPLAIELAAARTRTLTVEEITRRLDDRFSVLNDPSSRRPERRRSLRSTIGWSYELLFPDDQRGLWALAAFAGGAPLPAVEFVLEALGVPAAATIDVVDRLVDPVAGHPPRRPGCRRRAALPVAGQHPGLRDGGDDRSGRGRAGARLARALVRRRGGGVHGRRTQRRPGRASPVRPHGAREHRRGPGVERRARPDASPRPRHRVRLGLGRPGRQPRCGADRGRPGGHRRRSTRTASGRSPCSWLAGSRHRPVT